MFIDTVSDGVSNVGSLIRVSKSRLSLILNKVIFEVFLFTQPLFIKKSKHPNGQCKEYQMKNKLLFMCRTESTLHVLSVVSVLVYEQTGNHFSNDS